MRGQPQVGLRCFIWTTASMSSLRGPLGPGLLQVAFQTLRLFHGLRQQVSGSALPFPYADAAGFPFWYGLLSCAPSSGAHSAFTPPVARRHEELATWLSGDYHDRTFTG